MLFFNSNQQFKSIFESLEDRVLFDGVPDATFVLPQTDVDQPAPAQVQDAQAADISGPRELILVDAGVADSDQFLAEVLEANPDSMFEIRFLDSDQSVSCYRRKMHNTVRSTLFPTAMKAKFSLATRRWQQTTSTSMQTNWQVGQMHWPKMRTCCFMVAIWQVMQRANLSLNRSAQLPVPMLRHRMTW